MSDPTPARVPATPLDVEACARLLDDLILMLAPHDAQSIADANQLRALKLALPGMGKAEERLREMEAERDRVRAVHVRRHERLSAAVGLPAGYSADATIDAAIKIIDAARAVQPEETRTCTGVAARWCPIHGDCTGVPDEQIPTAPYSDHCSDRDCPLHGARSMHAAGNLSG